MQIATSAVRVFFLYMWQLFSAIAQRIGCPRSGPFPGKPPQVAGFAFGWPRSVGRVVGRLERSRVVGRVLGSTRGDDERALVVKLHRMHSVLRLGTQPEDLPHAAPYFDPVPSLSSDSVSETCLWTSLRQAVTHRCSELAKWLCLRGGHAHCYAILLVRIAWCLLGMISVHVQFLCRGLLQCRQGPRLSLSRWTPSYPLRARLPPLECHWNCRRYSTCYFHSQVCLDPRADVRSCRHGLDEAQLSVALRETTIFVSSVFTHMDLEGDHIVFARVGLVKISLQQCGHQETVDSSLEIFKSFILAFALPGDGHCEEHQAKHIGVSAGLLHASAGMRFLLELLGTAVILAGSTSSFGLFRTLPTCFWFPS